MSKLKAVLLTAILGSSSAAMAQPTISFTGGASAQLSWGTPASYTPAPVVRDHSYDYDQTAYQMPSSRTTYISLASALNLSTGRDVLRPQLNLRNTTSLTLRANSGLAFVQSVKIRFADGSMQSVPVNAWMSTRNRQPLEIGLRSNRRIETITITGSASGRVSYQVFAQANGSVELPQQPPVYQQPEPPVYQPHPMPPVYQPPSYGMSLASDMSFLNTDGRRFINVGADKGNFSTLRLTGASGSTYIQMVLVTFTNGQQQFMSVINMTLVRGESIDLPLDGHGANGIAQICVWTNDKGTQVTNLTGTFNASAL